MAKTKNFLKSITIDASLILIVLSIIGIFGQDVGSWIAEAGPLAEAINGLIGAVIGVLAIIGRVRADSKVKLLE